MSRGKRIPVVAAIDKVVCIVLNEAWIIVLICRQTIGQRNQLQRYATPECIIADFGYGERNCNGLQPAAVRKGAVADGLQADGQGDGFQIIGAKSVRPNVFHPGGYIIVFIHSAAGIGQQRFAILGE